jgi:hypothetical protein
MERELAIALGKKILTPKNVDDISNVEEVFDEG